VKKAPRVGATLTTRTRTLAGIPGTVDRNFRAEPVHELPLPPRVAAAMNLVGKSLPRLYQMGLCRIMVSQEPAGPGGALLWHLSISCTHRHPTWDEIKVARYVLLPDELTFGILLPPPNEYVNVPEQDHVFHVWETSDPRK
jgi:hypothetical protein